MIRFLRFHQIWKLIQPPKANTRKAMIKAITTFPPAWNTPKRQDCARTISGNNRFRTASTLYNQQNGWRKKRPESI